MVREDVEHIADPFGDEGVLSDVVKIGDAFDDVEGIIHSFRRGHVAGSELLDFRHLPIAVEAFEVSAVFFVPRVRFEQVEDLFCLVECVFVAGGPVIFGKGVNHESLAVDLFLLFEGLSFPIHHPEHPAKLIVPEVLHKIVIGALCQLEMYWLLIENVKGGKRPEYSGVKNQSFRGLRVYDAFVGHSSDEAAFFVARAICPERDNIIV